MDASVATQSGVVDPYGRGLHPSGHAGCATIAIAFPPLAPGFIPGIPNDAPDAVVVGLGAPAAVVGSGRPPRSRHPQSPDIAMPYSPARYSARFTSDSRPIFLRIQ
jgi:hypothetical protein